VYVVYAVVVILVVVFPSYEFVPQYCVGVAKMGVGKFQTAICGIVEMRLYYIKSPPSIVYLFLYIYTT
jgi:hypothetical protein